MNWKIPYIKNKVYDARDYLDRKPQLEKDLRLLFRNKISSTEIEICFFTLCGLKCAFCYQDHSDSTGITSIKEKADQVIDYLKNTDSLQKRINFQILGGEIFEDSLNLYNDYFYFVKKINDWCLKNLKDNIWYFTFISNMAFKLEKTQNNIEKFFKDLEKEKIKFHIATSWDPTGRPLKFHMESQFHKNINYFKEYIDAITFVLTKQTCNFLLKKRDSYLDFLYENFNVMFDFFTPNGNEKVLMPNDRLLYNTLSMLIKYYPNLNQVKEIKRKGTNPISCGSLSRMVILPDGSLTGCKHLDYKQEDYETPIDFFSNASIIEKWITKKECLGCEYFERCTLGCFLAEDHKVQIQNKELKECFMKLIFRDLND